MRKELWENTELVNKTFPVNVFHTRFLDHQHLGLHWHDHLEWVLIEQGHAVYQIGAQHIQAGPGDILCINSGELHAAFQPHQSFTLYAVVFHPSLLNPYHDDYETMNRMSPFLGGTRRFRSRINREDPRYPVIRSTLESLIKEFQDRTDGEEASVRALCLLLFNWYARWFSEELNTSSRAHTFLEKAERYKELFTYMEEGFRENPSVKQAAERVHLSPYHFCREFKELTGLTFVQYVQQQRIHEAERLLRDTPLSISEIAERVGCGSINGFSNLFRQHKGYPPSKARELWRQG